VCLGDEVNITCGYNFSDQITPVWKINGRTENIKKSSSFESPLVTSGIDTVLTVYSSDELMNQTTFMCEFFVSQPVYSAIGTLTVMGKSPV